MTSPGVRAPCVVRSMSKRNGEAVRKRDSVTELRQAFERRASTTLTSPPATPDASASTHADVTSSRKNSAASSHNVTSLTLKIETNDTNGRPLQFSPKVCEQCKNISAHSHTSGHLMSVCVTGARGQPVGVPQSEAAHVGSNQTGTDAQAVGGSERVHGAVAGWLVCSNNSLYGFLNF